jgi:hypothetical protein
MMGTPKKKRNAEVEIRSTEVFNPAIIIHSPQNSMKPNMPWMRRRGPPQRLIPRLPANMPIPPVDRMVPRATVEAKDSTNGVTNTSRIPLRRLAAVKNRIRARIPGRETT